MSVYSPHDLLPAPVPSSESPASDYFYHEVLKHLIPDTVRLMNNGIPIDMDKVEALEAVLDQVLAEVDATLAANPIIQRFQADQHSRLVEAYVAEQSSKMKPPSHFIKPFKPKDMTHRSYFMNEFAQANSLQQPSELIPDTNCPKWTARQVKPFADSRPTLQRLLDGTLDESTPLVQSAMLSLATDKSAKYNRRYELNISNSRELELPPFNPASPDQKHALLTDTLGYESEKLSDAYKDYDRKMNNAIRYNNPTDHIIEPKNKYSWDRDNVESLMKMTNDPDLQQVLQAFIDHSFSAIVRNNFVQAFYDYTIDGVLHGNYKLFGAKSMRFTSNAPNMLNLPSTKSIYSKPIKQCLIAPPGKVVLAIDYGALEDRVIASLTQDTNKCSVFLEGLDGHCLNAYGYFKEEIAEHMTLTNDTVTDVKEFYHLVESGHKELKAIRQKGKPATFGLSYGSFPNKVAATLKIPLSEAESIFNRYHNELYPGITEYRESYVSRTASDNGKIHMGLGCYIKTNNASKDIRTLHNATCQFWSILTLLTINKMHTLIDEANLQDRVQCISTIYDSIYFIVDNDADLIKWVNDQLVPIMCTDFMEDQTIKNEATAELGLDWADMTQIPNNATTKEITEVLNSL